MQYICLTMANVASVLVFMVLLAVIVEGREWRFGALKRIKRGYNTGGFGTSDFERSDENASVSRERFGCSEEQGGGRYDSESRELAYNKDDRSYNNRRNRSFSKATASATASAIASNQHHSTQL